MTEFERALDKLISAQCLLDFCLMSGTGYVIHTDPGRPPVAGVVTEPQFREVRDRAKQKVIEMWEKLVWPDL